VVPAGEDNRSGGGSILRIIAFNIHLGEHEEEIAAYLAGQLKQSGVVVFLLSEADRWHSRTSDRHTARNLAERLGLTMAYGAEFVEYSDKTPDRQGASGNAILCNCALRDARIVRHTIAYDWKKFGKFTDSARDGGRMALIADVPVGYGAVVRVVSAHLENRSDGRGVRNRWTILSKRSTTGRRS